MALRRLASYVAMITALGGSLAACSGADALNALSPGDASTVLSDVAYGPDVRQRLDVYTPLGKAPVAGWPLVVFFYGGSWNSGERKEYRFVGEALASRGIVAIVADYRLYPQVRYPAFLEDCAQALAFGFDNVKRLGVDPRRVFVMGHSAGAYNAAMLALDTRWLAHAGHAPGELAGWIGLAGPYDFLPSTNPDVQPVFLHPNYPARSQPIEVVSGTAPRGLLGAAAKDTVVNPERSTRHLARDLAQAGASVELRVYERPGHATLLGSMAWPLRWMAPVLDDVDRFIREGSAAP